MARVVLITGGSGYFGSILADRALAAGDRVRVFDLNPPAEGDAASSTWPATSATSAAAGGDRGRRRRAQQRGPGAPGQGPGAVLVGQRRRHRQRPAGGPRPGRVQGRARRRAPSSASRVQPGHRGHAGPAAGGLRPGQARGRAPVPRRRRVGARRVDRAAPHHPRSRPARHHRRTLRVRGRGRPVYVLGSGDNRYQFVHANDLADAVLRASAREKPSVYNIGATEFGTMRETLQALVDHAGTGSRVRSLPAAPARLGMKALATLGWPRSLPTTGCCTPSRCGSTRRRPPTSWAGCPGTPTPRRSSSPTSGSWPTGRPSTRRADRTTSRPSSSAC